MKSSKEQNFINKLIRLHNDNKEVSTENIEEIKNRSEQGDIEAMISYSSYLYESSEDPSTKKEAKKYAKLAADSGDLKGVINYCNILQNENDSELIKYIKIAADEGNPDCMFNYAIILYEGDIVSQNIEESLKYFKKAADEGNPSAAHNVLILIKDHTDEYLHYAKLGSDKGDSMCMYAYGQILIETSEEEEEEDDDDEKRKYKGANLIKLSAEKGFVDGEYQYGMMLVKGILFESDFESGIEWLKKAADDGHAQASLEYANILRCNDGDRQTYLSYFKKAADKGSTEAMVKYYQLYKSFDKEPTKEETEEAVRYLVTAYEKGDDNAKYQYMQCLWYGRNYVEKNIEKAIDICKQLVNSDYIMAIRFYIHYLSYDKKPRLKEDYIEITHLKKKLADFEDSSDFTNGIEIYEYAMWRMNEKNAPIDKNEAAIYMKKAADRNNYEAVKEYIRILKKGDGIPKDKNEAKRYEEIKKRLKKERKEALKA